MREVEVGGPLAARCSFLGAVSCIGGSKDTINEEHRQPASAAACTFQCRQSGGVRGEGEGWTPLRLM